jgi:hypothetical protein
MIDRIARWRRLHGCLGSFKNGGGAMSKISIHSVGVYGARVRRDEAADPNISMLRFLETVPEDLQNSRTSISARWAGSWFYIEVRYLFAYSSTGGHVFPDKILIEFKHWLKHYFGRAAVQFNEEPSLCFAEAMYP